MWWQYVLVYVISILMDITPLPLPSAFTVMILLQIVFNLAIWPVIIFGVVGSIIDRYILTLYIPSVADRILQKDKNDDVRFLGEKMKTRGWRGQLFILYVDALAFNSVICGRQPRRNEVLLYHFSIFCR